MWDFGLWHMLPDKPGHRASPEQSAAEGLWNWCLFFGVEPRSTVPRAQHQAMAKWEGHHLWIPKFDPCSSVPSTHWQAKWRLKTLAVRTDLALVDTVGDIVSFRVFDNFLLLSATRVPTSHRLQSWKPQAYVLCKCKHTTQNVVYSSFMCKMSNCK